MTYQKAGALMLTLIMAAALTACGGGSGHSADGGSSAERESSEETAEVSGEVKNSETTGKEPTVTDAPSEEVEPTEEPLVVDEAYVEKTLASYVLSTSFVPDEYTYELPEGATQNAAYYISMSFGADSEFFATLPKSGYLSYAMADLDRDGLSELLLIGCEMGDHTYENTGEACDWPMLVFEIYKVNDDGKVERLDQISTGIAALPMVTEETDVALDLSGETPVLAACHWVQEGSDGSHKMNLEEYALENGSLTCLLDEDFAYGFYNGLSGYTQKDYEDWETDTEAVITESEENKLLMISGIRASEDNKALIYYISNQAREDALLSSAAGEVIGTYEVEAPDNFVNLRTGPGINYSVIVEATNGTRLEVTAMDGDWARTCYDGRVGWFNTYYCQKVG